MVEPLIPTAKEINRVMLWLKALGYKQNSIAGTVKKQNDGGVSFQIESFFVKRVSLCYKLYNY